MQNQINKTIAGEEVGNRIIKRIGSTTYVVNVHFSEKSNESMTEKIMRMVEREAA